MSTEVGTAYATILPSAKGFARNLQREIAKEFAGLDRMIADALGDTRIKLHVDPVVDTSRIESVADRPVRLPIEVSDHEAASEVARAAHHAERSAPRVRLRVDVDAESTRGLGRLSSLASAGLGQLSSAASTMVGAVATATSSLSGLATVFLTVLATAQFTTPALYLVGGAIGALPAVVAGAVAALGALSLGLMGIADHFKQVSSGGGGAGQNLAAQARQVAQATRGVESAERSLARAQREVILAQQAVTRARAAEAERLQDLNRSVARARLDEEDAALRVKEAEEDLSEARKSGNALEVERAELAYRQALLGVEDARDATEDLVAEQEKSAKVGVEGSDQVQEALRRQQDAIEGVTAANEQLLSAQEALQAANEKPPSGGGAAQELTKLAPAAQRFVDAVKSLKPAFERLRLNVQQKLFAGLDKTVKSLASAWFPQLNKTLGDYATTFNGLAKRAAKSLSQKSFIDNMAAGAEAARGALDRIGKAVSGPLVDAFGRLSRAAAPFIKRLGDEVAGLVEDFSKWIEKLDKNGSLDTFFVRAGQIFSDLIDMGKDIFSIFGSIASILFGEEDLTTSPWEGLKKTLDDIAKWFKDPENQQKVRDFLDKVDDFFSNDLPQAVLKAKDAIDTVDGWFDTIEEWKRRLTDFRDRVREVMAAVGSALRAVANPIGFALGQFSRLRSGADGQVSSLLTMMRGVPGRILSALGNTGRLLYQAGRNILQGLINGMFSKFGALHNVGSAVAGAIADYFPHSPAKRGPLSGSGSPYLSGRTIVGMLSSGITDTLGTAQSAASDLAGAFALSGSPGAGMSMPSSSSAPPPAPVVVGFGGDAPDSFMRWMRENVRIYYGGSPQAALGS